MAQPCPIPFFAPKSQLPAPLLSRESIELNGKILQEYTGRRIVQFGDHYIIKYGVNVSLTDGKNMWFIHQTQIIPVPQVFALYSEPHSDGANINYIIMERVVGQRLDDVWSQLDTLQKTKIASQLRSQVDRLRSLTAPGFFGCIDKQPFEDPIFWSDPDDNLEYISGPFDTEQQLNDALIQKYNATCVLKHKANFYRRMFPKVLHYHNPVFTHGDLQRKNIILMENGAAIVIDWETAGWYPEYWEYASAMAACGAWKDDWHEYVAQILKEYPNEYVWFDMFRRELCS